MKKLLLLGLTVITIAACKQEERYFSDSTETATLKSGISSYESGDWETWKSHFSDTAKVFVNSTDGMSVENRLTDLKNMTGAMSSYGFDHESDHIEMVIDKKDETWVYYWATHKGTFAATNKELTIPVHLAVRFVDGKIVTEHVYFDATEMNAEFAAIEAMAEPEEEEEEGEEGEEEMEE
jgi:ketosteroid isomerase-like protein